MHELKQCLIKPFETARWQRAGDGSGFAEIGWRAEETCFSQLAAEMHRGTCEWDTRIDLVVVGSKKNVYY